MKQFDYEEQFCISQEAADQLPEIRYQAMNHYILKTGYREVLELGCESTRRGIYLVEEKGLHYVGAGSASATMQFCKEAEGFTCFKIGRLSYRNIELTDGASVYRAASELKGPVTIITNGILNQYEDEERPYVIENIRNLLRAKGGCWIASENRMMGEELGYIYGLSARKVSCFPEGMQRKLLDIPNNSDIYEELSGCFLHVITAKNDSQTNRQEMAMDGGLSYSYEVQEGEGIINLNGSLDSTTGPSLMDFFKTELSHGEVDRIRINCEKLDYLSSKGIRILQSIDTKIAGGILIYRASQSVRSALNSTSLKME